MSEKSEQKRALILLAAKEVFMEKGFKNVTMKDIVDASEISRGGLYLYFSSTEEIFLEVLKLEQQDEDDVFKNSIPKNVVPSDILALFLKEQKREILRRKNNLAIAIYEFFFQNKGSKKDNLLKQQFDEAVSIIEELIQAGVEAGEFYCEDPYGKASNIMYVLEGLKIAARTMGISESTIDREVYFIMQGLLIEDFD